MVRNERPSFCQEGRALARLFLPDQILEELVGKGLMRHPGVNFGGLLAVGCRDGQQFSVNLVGSDRFFLQP